MSTDNPDYANVVALPPLIMGGFLVLGLVIHFVYPVSVIPRSLGPWLGTPLILLSGLIVVSAFRALRRGETTFDVRESTTNIVSDGVFQYSRNPMYLSGLLLYVGLAFLINSLWILVLSIPLAIVIQKGVIEREEQYLERKFGEEYLSYMKRVRRWI